MFLSERSRSARINNKLLVHETVLRLRRKEHAAPLRMNVSLAQDEIIIAAAR